MQKIKKTLTPFLIAVQFLTRIPVSFLLNNNQVEIYTQKNLSRTLKYYPLIGLILGAALVAFTFLLQSFAQSHSLYISGLVVSFWILITGGLHLDGVADMADAWVGGLGDKQKTLDIMKDPVCGPFAVIAVVLVILLKFILVYELIQYNPYFLLVPPLFSRSLVVVLLMITPYVRKNGMGSMLNTASEKYKNITSIFVLIAACIYFLNIIVDINVIIGVSFLSVVFYFLFRMNIIKRVSGLTGDLAGAFIEYTELVVLLGFVTLLHCCPVNL